MSVWDALPSSRAALGVAKQLAVGDIPHAWLLLGPSGSGKRPFAVAMAAAIVCREEPGVGCGRCSSCLRILRHRHPDVHHVVPEGPLIPVDAIRDSVIREAARSPFESSHKVFIIEEADRMNAAAQNALLKTLEEPQPDTVLILVSEHEEDLLETVRSRCAVTRLEPLGTADVAAVLERDGASPEVAALVARLSNGDIERSRALAFDEDAARRRAVWTAVPRRIRSPAEALEVAAEVIDESKVAVKDLEVQQKAEVAELADAMGEGRGTGSARQALTKRHRREVRRREQEVLGELLETLAGFYRDVVAFRAGGAGVVMNTDLVPEIEAWAAGDVGDRELVAASERCLSARADLPLNANPLLTIEATLLEVARLVPAPSRLTSAS